MESQLPLLKEQLASIRQKELTDLKSANTNLREEEQSLQTTKHV